MHQPDATPCQWHLVSNLVSSQHSDIHRECRPRGYDRLGLEMAIMAIYKNYPIQSIYGIWENVGNIPIPWNIKESYKPQDFNGMSYTIHWNGIFTYTMNGWLYVPYIHGCYGYPQLTHTHTKKKGLASLKLTANTPYSALQICVEHTRLQRRTEKSHETSRHGMV